MGKNRRGGRNNRKMAPPALKTLDPAILDKLAKSVAVHLHELQTVQPVTPAQSAELVPVKDSLPVVAETQEKRSNLGFMARPALVFLGIVKGGLKLAQSTFCKDIENEWVKNNAENLFAAGIGVVATFLRPNKPLENAGLVVVGKTVAQPLGQLMITRLDYALGWSQKKIEAYQKKLDAEIASMKDASFSDVGSVETKTEAQRTLPALDNMVTFPPPKPDPVEASAAQPAAAKNIGYKRA